VFSSICFAITSLRTTHTFPIILIKILFLLALLFLGNGLDDTDRHGLTLSRTANRPIGGKSMNVPATVVEY